MKKLIIGAAGFVGSYLIEELLKNDSDIYATKLPNEQINYDIHVLDLDITDINAVNDILSKVRPDVIYHLAAQSSVKLSWGKPQLTADINFKGAINLFESIKCFCPKCKVVVIGSSEEYGDINYGTPVKETEIPEPKNIYALTKFAQEKLANIYVKAYQLNIVMTRSFNHFGPRQSSQFVVADFCSQVAKIEAGLQEPVIRVGNLNAYRDFTDVRDVVKAYIFLAEKGQSGNIYNVGCGKAISIKHILDLIISFSSASISIKVDESKFRPIDIPIIEADISKISKLGWKASIPVEKTLLETLNYFRGIVQ